MESVGKTNCEERRKEGIVRSDALRKRRLRNETHLDPEQIREETTLLNQVDEVHTIRRRLLLDAEVESRTEQACEGNEGSQLGRSLDVARSV